MTTTTTASQPVIYEYQRVLAYQRKHNAWQFREEEKPTKKAASAVTTQLNQSPVLQRPEIKQLKQKIKRNQKILHEQWVINNATITPRTQAHNRKCEFKTVEEEQAYRATIVGEQIKTWRCLLPMWP